MVKQIKKIVLGLLCLFSCQMFSDEIRITESMVKKNVSQLGYKIGFDKERKTFVFIGSWMDSHVDPQTPSFLLHRERTMKHAELKAKESLLRYLCQIRFSEEKVFNCEFGEMLSRDIITTDYVFAKNRLSGWYVLTTAESFDNANNVYSMSVAIIWSPLLERMGRAAREGKVKGSDTYIEELTEWLRSQKLAHWSGTRVFVDSNGYPHLLGIGLARIQSKHVLEVKKQRMIAEMFASKNLLLALRGDSAVCRVAEDRLKVRPANQDEIETTSFYMAAANVEDRNVSIKGMAPVYECYDVHPITMQKMIIVVYGIKPSEFHLNFLDYDKTKNCEKINSRAKPKVFNPHTGKFE